MQLNIISYWRNKKHGVLNTFTVCVVLLRAKVLKEIFSSSESRRYDISCYRNFMARPRKVIIAWTSFVFHYNFCCEAINHFLIFLLTGPWTQLGVELFYLPLVDFLPTDLSSSWVHSDLCLIGYRTATETFFCCISCSSPLYLLDTNCDGNK